MRSGTDVLVREYASMDTEPPVRFASRLDVDLIARVFAQAGRVHITPILTTECAERCYRCLANEVPWQLHLNDGDRPVNLAMEPFEQLPQENKTRFLQAVYANAAQRFQYLFNSFPISDFYERNELRSLYVMRVHEFLNSPEFLAFARKVTGVPDIVYADSQATLYRSGHFLTRHDDANERKKRVAAYVLSLTPRWNVDWGGVLQFIDAQGHVIEGYTPTFNALNPFRVPQLHSVSYVAPFAQGGRFSVTGWLRTERPDHA